MKKLIFILIIAALAGGGWYYFQGQQTEEPEYQTALVTRGDLTQGVTATGTLNPVLNVQVGSQISGNIQKLFADFNTEVKAGQVVAQLDAATYEAAVRQSEGDVANAKAALELARLTEKRKAELVAQKAAPQADLDSARAALAQAQANVQMKEANLQRAKVDLSRCTIYSPIDGIVISRDVDVGQTVAATMNAPVLFKIANDLQKMQINAAIAEADIGNVIVGQDVEFTVDAFPGRTFHGTVEQVRNAATTVQNVVTYDTVIAVSNEDLKLKPGMTANVSVIIAQRQNILKLPNAALRFRLPESEAKAATTATPARDAGAGSQGGSGRRGGRARPPGAAMDRTIYVLASGKPAPVQVKLGISDGISTELLEGLKEGDPVVTGVIMPQASAPAPAGGANPLGGGRRRF